MTVTSFLAATTNTNINYRMSMNERMMKDIHNNNNNNNNNNNSNRSSNRKSKNSNSNSSNNSNNSSSKTNSSNINNKNDNNNKENNSIDTGTILFPYTTKLVAISVYESKIAAMTQIKLIF